MTFSAVSAGPAVKRIYAWALQLTTETLGEFRYRQIIFHRSLYVGLLRLPLRHDGGGLRLFRPPRPPLQAALTFQQ